MKSHNLLWLIVLGLVLSSCENPVTPAINPSSNDTIVPIDTITNTEDTTLITPPSNDTIVPIDTITITNDTVIIGTGRSIPYYYGDDYGRHENLVIVKFYNDRQDEKVIVQHPVKRYDGLYTGRFEYYEDNGLFLNVLSEQCPSEWGLVMDPQLVEWMEKEMHIAGSSPYIPLAGGYYLIDWKWHQLMPISMLSSAWKSEQFAEHIINHCFMTDINWKDLHDLTAGYDNSKYTQHVRGIEIIRALYRTIDKLYDDEKDSARDPYLCRNETLYGDGLTIDNAYGYYKYGDCTNSGKTYRSYITYCDSLQAVYQHRLIEIINNGKLKEIGF